MVTRFCLTCFSPGIDSPLLGEVVKKADLLKSAPTVSQISGDQAKMGRLGRHIAGRPKLKCLSHFLTKLLKI